MPKLLEIDQLQTQFYTSMGTVLAVDGISYDVMEGETVALVGESGCGKSVSALSILRLIPDPPGKIVGGRLIFSGQDLLQLEDREIRKVRGRDISMIFQEPMTSLNPVFSVGEQIAEVLCAHQGLSKREVKQQAVRLLEAVKIPLPDRRVNDYPHQLSGGMRQRVMIAIALACKPKVLIADEPTTALDVTVQAHIFELLQELREQTGTSIILITHDMASVAEMAERVMVMYAGRKVE